MRYTRFGQTGLQVSRICFGSWQAGGDWGEIDEASYIDAVRAALDAGVTFFDTAQAYGFGEAEELLAKGLGDRIYSARDELVIATKGGLRLTDDGLERDSSAAWLREGLEDSLRHLGTEYVDFYQIHWPDHDTPFEQTAEVLAEFVDEGKVRTVGVSNFDTDQMEAFRRGGPLHGLQPPYHFFRRDPEESVFPYCLEHGIGVLVYGPLAHGLATGTMSPETTFPAGDWRSGSDVFAGEEFATNLDVVERLREIADGKGCTLPQLAVAWTLSHPAVDASIIGSTKPEHVTETAAAGDMELTAEELSTIDLALLDTVPVGGPTPEG
jgi:aryl-alcohol dehydrogenase-like predicted oxidoreductase